jgi:hypothetical protein
VKSACLVHVVLNGTNNFQKASKVWKMMTAQVTHTNQLPLTALKKCEMWFEKTLGWVFKAMTETINLDRGSVWRILTDTMNMKKVCAKMFPKMLSAK